MGEGAAAAGAASGGGRMTGRWIARAAVAAILAIAAPRPAAAAEAITVLSFEGPYAVAQLEAFHKPFTAATGIPVNAVAYDGRLPNVRELLAPGAVVADVVDLDIVELERGCAEGLLEPIDPAILSPGIDGTPAAEDFLPGALHPCGVATVVWSSLVAYDAAAFPGEKPATIADFFDTERFPGRRAIGRWPWGNLEWALMADGVAPHEVYAVLSTPAGLDRAFAKLDGIKDHLVFWERGSEPARLLAAGEVAMASAYSGQIVAAARDADRPVAVLWDGHLCNFEYFAILADSPNKAGARAFIAFATGSGPLAAQARYLPYGPARRSAMPLVDPAVAPLTPTAPENLRLGLAFDHRWWADRADALNERFAAWLAR